MIDQLLHIDQFIFHFINSEIKNIAFDTVMPLFRKPIFWLPLYLFLAFYVIKKFGWRGVFWILFYLLVFGYADFFSASILKPYFSRLRPCQNPDFYKSVNLLIPCGSGKSMPSTHATNHFAMSTFIYFTLLQNSKNKIEKILVFFWAFLVCFAQVYVGVHYPLDVFAGTLLGLSIGSIFAWIYSKKFTYPINQN